MRIVLFSASSLGLRILEQLGRIAGIDMAGVLTLPREFKISYAGDRPVQNVLHEDLAPFCREHDIPLRTLTGKLSDPDVVRTIEEWNPEFILVAGWYHKVPQSIRSIPAKGIAGLHASLLPRYRGGAPLVWAVIRGEKETGVTLFHLSEGVDDGDIIGQRKFPIGEEETIDSLVRRAETAATELVAETLPLIASNRAPRTVQNLGEAFVVPQRSPEDGRIDWNQKAHDLFNFIRAQTRPYPGAFFDYKGTPIRVWSCRPVESRHGVFPGEVLRTDPDLLIKTAGEEALLLLTLGTPMGDYDGASFANIFAVVSGERLG